MNQPRFKVNEILVSSLFFLFYLCIKENRGGFSSSKVCGQSSQPVWEQCNTRKPTASNKVNDLLVSSSFFLILFVHKGEPWRVQQ